MIRCPGCGAPISETAAFCTFCGEKISSSAQGAEEQYRNTQNNQQNYQQNQQNYQQNQQNYAGGYNNGYATPPSFGPVSFLQRNIAIAIILSIITCGIYGIYWFICMVNEVNEAAGKQDGMSGGIVFLLSLVTCGIFQLYWYYKAGEDISLAKRGRGLPVDSSMGLIYLLLGIFGLGIVSYALIQNELNKISEWSGHPKA